MIYDRIVSFEEIAERVLIPLVNFEPPPPTPSSYLRSKSSLSASPLLLPGPSDIHEGGVSCMILGSMLKNMITLLGQDKVKSTLKESGVSFSAFFREPLASSLTRKLKFCEEYVFPFCYYLINKIFFQDILPLFSEDVNRREFVKLVQGTQGPEQLLRSLDKMKISGPVSDWSCDVIEALLKRFGITIFSLFLFFFFFFFQRSRLLNLLLSPNRFTKSGGNVHGIDPICRTYCPHHA